MPKQNLNNLNHKIRSKSDDIYVPIYNIFSIHYTAYLHTYLCIFFMKITSNSGPHFNLTQFNWCSFFPHHSSLFITCNFCFDFSPTGREHFNLIRLPTTARLPECHAQFIMLAIYLLARSANISNEFDLLWYIVSKQMFYNSK